MKYLARSPNDIGHAIREARKADKLTQKQLAELSGTWQETISKIENGVSSTRLDTLFDLLSALDLEIIVRNRSKGRTSDLEQLLGGPST